MSRYKKPCPNPPKGEKCPLCGSSYICLQPERKGSPDQPQQPAQKAQEPQP